MILQLDAGNSAAKWRLSAAADAAVPAAVQARGVLSPAAGLPALAQAPQAVWVASVRGAAWERQLRRQCRRRWSVEPWFARSCARAGGLSNSYAEPEQLGVDRWLALLAAWTDCREALCLVDAGSALTIDFVSAAGAHRGGYILPGIASMERALLADTERLCCGAARRASLAPGRATAAAVANGLLLSQAGAVALARQRCGDDSRLYVCGGQGAALLDALELEGEFHAELVLDGLALMAAEQCG